MRQTTINRLDQDLIDLVELVDDAGRSCGVAPRERVHDGCTPRHRAFSAYLTDPDGRVLLTRRALGKRTWPGVWSNACCGHPRPGESDESALRRRVREELGVPVDEVALLLPDFGYVARDAGGVVENELCPVFRATVPELATVCPDPAEVMELQWIEWPQLVSLTETAPALLSPWCVLQVRQLAAAGASPVRSSPVRSSPLRSGSLRSGSPVGSVGDVAETLRQVDAAVADVWADVAAEWSQLDAPTVDLLDADLPDWLSGLMAGNGKRIRSAMCHWGFVAAGGVMAGPSYQELVRAAAAVELLHGFALIHDDVMDDSAVRRGSPTPHRQVEQWHAAGAARGDGPAFGRNVAILAGDLALVEADRLASTLRPALRDCWHAMCLEIVAGQRGDLTGAASGRFDRRDADRVARLKSGSYTVARPVLLGALAADGSARAREALSSFGAHAGMAFALRDDVLGVWGDPGTTGKPAGDDLLSGKPTVLAALAAERLTARAAAALARAGTPGMSSEDVDLLRTTMTATGIRDEVEQVITRHVEAARRALAVGGLRPAGVAGLLDLTTRLAWRSA